MSPATATEKRPAPPAAAVEALGQQGYRLRRLLGSGGFATVHQASHPELGEVAVKIVAGRPKRHTLERMTREASLMHAMSHPHVVRVHAWHATNAHGWIVMELATRTVKDELLSNGAYDEQEAVGLAADVGSALCAMHAFDVVHRDVKPSNLLLCPEGVKLADFGIARTPGSDLTVRGQSMGSPSFMAPEQHFDASASKPATDVYGLCASLYSMLTRRSPRSMHVLNIDHRRWQRIADPDLRALLHAGMASMPARRPTMADLTAQLEARRGAH